MTVVSTGTVRRIGIGVGGIGLGFGLWWVAVVLFAPPTYILPAPAAVLGRLAGNPTLYIENAWITTQKVLLGGGVGAASGIVLGVLIAKIRVLRASLLPYLVTMRVLPKIAIAPVLLIYFGLGMQTAILFVAIIAVFPVAISTAAGFERVPERHLDLLQSVAANPRRTLVRVEARYALPDVFAGLKQAAALSVIGAIVAEWIVSTSGLGYLILVASETVQTTVLLAALLLLVAVGLAIYGSVALFQRVTVGPSSRYAGPT